jgi:DnaD/phage-associated family protein
MKPFSGFPVGKTRFTSIPDLFFSELVPSIGDADELRLTLFMFWFLNRQQGYPRYMTLPELEAEGLLLSTLRADGADSAVAIERLHAAVERAVARGTLLRLRIEDQEGHCDYLFMNTPQGRRAVAQVHAGELLLERVGRVREPHVERPRPSIFSLYEQNIGLLQPLLAEELAAAERDYPQEWIEDAFRLAAEQNARNWRYIRAILERWARDGKDDGDLSRNAGRRRGGRGA